MGVEGPERTKHFLPRLSRAELGSFADDYAAEEFDVEVRRAVCCVAWSNECCAFGLPSVPQWSSGAALLASQPRAAVVAVLHALLCALLHAGIWAQARCSTKARCFSANRPHPAHHPRLTSSLPLPPPRRQVDLFPEVPEDVPLYNLRSVVPEIYEPRCDISTVAVAAAAVAAVGGVADAANRRRSCGQRGLARCCHSAWAVPPGAAAVACVPARSRWALPLSAATCGRHMGASPTCRCMRGGCQCHKADRGNIVVPETAQERGV